MATNLVNIFSTDKPYYAELIRQMLSEHHIHSFIVNKQDSAYKFGEIELFVHRDHVIRAKMLIREFEEN
ncbi:MAG: DUF2007 domain-containing protein [Bacteroidales bacterium]